MDADILRAANRLVTVYGDAAWTIATELADAAADNAAVADICRKIALAIKDMRSDAGAPVGHVPPPDHTRRR